MKKFLKFCCFVLLIPFLTSCNTLKDNTIYKSENGSSSYNNGVYIVSNSVEKSYVDFAKEIFDKSIKDKFVINRDNISNEDGVFYLSEPYSIKDETVSFLIFENNKCICVLSVWKNKNKLSYQFSSGYFVDEINKFLSSNSNGIYKLSFLDDEKTRPTPIFKKIKDNDIPREKITYNIKNSIKKVKIK